MCIAVIGELDLSNAGELKDVLSRELSSGRRVLLDLSDVTFIDSSGLAAIVNSYRGATHDSGQLAISPQLPSQARRLMELTGVLSMLSMDADDGVG